ncbi:hypothetical protein PR048_011128 [Dryococelus australis]|uniref:Uncharacterized protein n=1 Tax=Dryococelus australis TaxID=614101 RepID=A0ABQ9HL15_9NEOP|nr:hypothetical protein PR048_011128 [Dryococelus australis]
MKGKRKRVDPRENLPTSSIIRHNSPMRKFRGDSTGNLTQFTYMEASSLNTTPPQPLRQLGSMGVTHIDPYPQVDPLTVPSPGSQE